MTYLRSFIFCLVLVAFFHKKTWSAACCGGGSGGPALIQGDQSIQIMSQFSSTDVIVSSVDSQGFWRDSVDPLEVRTFQLEVAALMSDRWQGGLILPLIERKSNRVDSKGLGDISLITGYEFLNSWTYNPLIPKGIFYQRIILPTGKSKVESELGGLDSRGNGFLSLGLGVSLSKSWSRWDGFANLEIRRSFPKSFERGGSRGQIEPGWGGHLTLQSGYTLGKFRGGAGLMWNYEDPLRLAGDIDSQGSIERYGTGIVSLSYFRNDDWTFQGSYSDQTLIGSPINTSLGRTVSLSFQRQWLR